MEPYRDSDSSFSTDSDFNSAYLDLVHYNLYPLLPPGKALLIPVEIFSEIFLYVIQTNPSAQRNLMCVCRHWYAIMLSTPGIRAQLSIRRSTKKKDVEALGRWWLLDVTVDMNDGQDFSPDNFYESFMAAARGASRWRSLELISFPPPEEYKNLEIVRPLQQLSSFKLAPGCNLGNLLEPLMTAITTTTTPRLTLMEIADPDAVLYLVQPAHIHVFHSLRTLKIQLSRRTEAPVDILPHLGGLKSFEACHLFLPAYPPDTHLPLIRTLHVLYLKSVSVQWMAGQEFPALQKCAIIFPQDVNTIAFQPVTMSSCSFLTYDSNDLSPLLHFSLPPLAKLEVKCGQWSTSRGNLQLAIMQPIVSANAQSLTSLHLQVRCSEKILVNMLRLVPALEKLWLGLASPNALSEAFFHAFIAIEPNASGMIGLSSHTVAPVCRALKKLHLHYKRWLRASEKKELISVFGLIVAAHQSDRESDSSLTSASGGTAASEEEYDFLLHLTFDEGPKEQVWEVYEPAKRPELENGYICIGIPSTHGVVHLSAPLGLNGFISPPFKELEYLLVLYHDLDPIDVSFPIDYIFPFHNLTELRITGIALDIQPHIQLPPHLSLFHTLKILDVDVINNSLLAGHTFQKLERYREGALSVYDNSRHSLLTEMPVCSRLSLSLPRLASFRLPQVSELGLFFFQPESNMIWEKYIAINANLSGLKLLHVMGWSAEVDPIQFLRYLPGLERLIITWKCAPTAYLGLFKAFVPMHIQDTSGLSQLSREGQILRVLCPKLETLQIEDIDPTKLPELRPILEDIVTLHAAGGFPLKGFNFYDSGRKWELIGRDGCFTMKEVIPAERFHLDI